MYGLPRQKVKLLLMGAEDEKIDLVFTEDEIVHLYKNNNIKCNDFIIVAGGKIDINKSQILLLMDAVKGFDNIKLILFGSVSSELKIVFEEKISENICFIGWQNSEQIYRLFNLADLIVFPGLHSVLWEQAVGQGKPCVFKYIKGFTHIDIGGNCYFLYEDSIAAIRRVLDSIILDTEVYEKMKQSARDINHSRFLYSNIASKSINT
jgi:glycosyltransferase involved in cell wall biosynthesis